MGTTDKTYAKFYKVLFPFGTYTGSFGDREAVVKELFTLCRDNKMKPILLTVASALGVEVTRDDDSSELCNKLLGMLERLEEGDERKNLKYVYSVYTRARSKLLEERVPDLNLDTFDEISLVFQSKSLTMARDFYDNLDSFDGKFWRSIGKYILKTPLDYSPDDGFFNEELIESQSL